MYQITNSLLGLKSIEKPLPKLTDITLENQYGNFFEEKVFKIINNLPPPLLPAEITFTEESIAFDTIYPPSQSYILKFIQNFKIN